MEISNEVYETGRFLILKKGIRNFQTLKNKWDVRANMRNIPSVIIQNLGKFSKISVDADPLSGIHSSLLQKQEAEITSLIDKLVLEFNLKSGDASYGCIQANFKIPTEQAGAFAERLYELFLSAMKNTTTQA